MDNELGERIRNIRLKMNMKQSDLAEKSGINRISIGNYERGDRIPNIDILKKIATALEVPVSTLTNDEVEVEVILKNLSTYFSDVTIDNMKTIKPLDNAKLVEVFKCLAISIPNIQDLAFDNDKCIYNMLHSDEFAMFINLLMYKYRMTK